MAEDESFSTTLAYTKSPKTSRRTTFQDELESAIFARAGRRKPADRWSYSDDFDDDDDGDEDDDVLKELLNTRKKKLETFKAGKMKAQINDFKLSGGEEENIKPKRVSFMKTRRKTSPVQDEQLDSGKSERTDTANSVDSNHSATFHSRSTNQDLSPFLTPEKSRTESILTSYSEKSQAESPLLRKGPLESPLSRKSLLESPLPLNWENSQWESLMPLPSQSSQLDSPLALPSGKSEEDQRMVIGGEEELPIPQPRGRSVRPRSSAGNLVEDEPPRPKPRQRTLNLGSQVGEEGLAEVPAEMLSSQAATSSVSIAISSMERADTTSSSGKMGTSRSDSCQEESEHQPDIMMSRQSHVTEDSCYTRPSSSRTSGSKKSQSSYTVESKYLGTLKVLDQKMPLKESQPEAADSLRAAIYQEWLKKKREKSQATMRAKKEEEKLEEKKKEEEQAKREGAKASYEVWKERKGEVIRAKVEEKREVARKRQKEMDEKEGRKETAKKVFEKWKEGHDELLKEKFIKQKQTENKLKQKKETDQEERKKDCTSTFSRWYERKEDVIQEKVKTERRKEKIKEEEAKYEKEERDGIALEMYEKWLRRKECQQKRERTERRIQAILQDEPPPPWSPPNKTVPFGK